MLVDSRLLTQARVSHQPVESPLLDPEARNHAADWRIALGTGCSAQTILDAAPVEGDDHPLPGHAVQQTARRALLGRSGPRSVAIGGRAEGLDIQGDAVGAELRLRFRQRSLQNSPTAFGRD